jgi:hypothetical protein
VTARLLAAVAAATIAAFVPVSVVAARPASAGMHPAWDVATHQLFRELAVLRRPQRAGDLNASLLRAENIRVTWIQTLMRRVRIDGRDVYLVPAQSTVLGSGLAVFSPSGMTCCVSAKGVTEGGAFVNRGPSLWMLGVVPDGVARVTIKAHGRTFPARVTDNTVDVRSRLMNDVQEMTWYGPDGTVLKRIRALSNDGRAGGKRRSRGRRSISGPGRVLHRERVVGWSRVWRSAW